MLGMNPKLLETVRLNCVKSNTLLAGAKKKLDAFIFFCLCAGCIREAQSLAAMEE